MGTLNVICGCHSILTDHTDSVWILFESPLLTSTNSNEHCCVYIWGQWCFVTCWLLWYVVFNWTPHRVFLRGRGEARCASAADICWWQQKLQSYLQDEICVHWTIQWEKYLRLVGTLSDCKYRYSSSCHCDTRSLIIESGACNTKTFLS